MVRSICSCLVLACLTTGVVAEAAEEVIFPAAATVVDITKPPYSATPDDQGDDTAAFQKALADDVNLIYIPHGTYVISDTLRWGAKEKRQIFQGQSQAGTILRLKDSAQGFGDVGKPKAMIWTGKAPAQRFRNGLRDLTIDTGTGNPGAIGAQFVANNQGGIRKVTIRSGAKDGSGKIGLDLGYTDEQGPCLIQDLTVIGFDVGVGTGHAVNSLTFERLNLKNQRIAGFYNDGQCVSIRGFKSENAVPAYVNVAGPSLTAMIDAELTGTEANDAAAIVNEAYLFARNIKTTRYSQAIRNATGNKEHAAGPNVEEFVSHPVLSNFPTPPRSLNLPVLETPAVPWGELSEWKSVTDFGPARQITLVRKADGKKFEREDWSEALQKAIDSGARTVYFPYRKEGYGLFGTVRLRNNVHRVIGLETDSSMLVNSNQEKTDYQDDFRPVFILEDGTAPAVVVERFNSWYAATRFEQHSKRALVISSMSTYDIVTQPGSGDVFLDDVRTKEIRVNQSRLFGRQVNPEGWEEPRLLNDGGQVWILGLKTENPSTIGITKNGGKTEIVGGFFYSNKGSDTPLRMFVVDDGSSFSVTGGGWKTRKGRSFDTIVEETRHGDTRLFPREKSYGRGEANAIPLFVAYPKPAAAAPKAPTGMKVQPQGSSRVRVSWSGTPQGADGVLADVRDGEKVVASVMALPSAGALTVQRGLQAGRSYQLVLSAFNGAGSVTDDSCRATFELPTIEVPADGTGLAGEYFNDPDFSNSKTRRTDATIGFDWAAERPAPGLPAKEYSVRWTGHVVPRFCEEYTFVLDLSGAARLFVDDQLVIDAWPTAEKKEVGRIELEAGRRHAVRLEYANHGGGGKIALGWFSPSQTREPVPATQLHPATPALPAVSIEPRRIDLQEDGEPLKLTITRTGDASAPLDVPLELGGQAVSSVDFALLPDEPTVRFAAGQTTATIEVKPIDDKAAEPAKQLRLELIPSPKFFTNGSLATIALIDNDLPPRGDGSGLLGEYFSDADLKALAGTRIDKQLSFGWDKKKPIADVDPAQPYSVRWSGQIQPLFSEAYTLEMTRSKYSGVRVFIDGKPVIDRWDSRTRAKGASKVDGDEPAEAVVRLEAGRRHDLVIEFVHRRAYGSHVGLKWSSASQFEEVVPTSQLYPAEKNRP